MTTSDKSFSSFTITSAGDPARVLRALGLPDVTSLDLATADVVMVAASLEAQVLEANRRFALLCRPVTEMLEAARARIRTAIAEAGGKAFPHDTFEVTLEQTMVRDKRIDVLRELEGKLPDEEFAAAVYQKVADPVWVADLTKLNTYARKYGGEIAEIVERGAPRVAVGQPKLSITPRKSAMKAVTP